jgi:hypothetical protein
MIAPGGGISRDGSRWIAKRPDFFLPVRVLSKLFRRLMIEKLVAAHAAGRLTFHGAHAALVNTKAFAAHLAPLKRTRWFVYAKRPFAGPKAVLAYLSRYTHRVAISNRRLIAADAKAVTFKVKDYRIDGPGRYKTRTLYAHEFIRRFLIHVLPKGFHRIRHYGLLASGVKADNLVLARKLLDAAPPEPEDAASDPAAPVEPCPCCGSTMRIIEVFKAGESPRHRPTAMPRRRHQDRHLMSPGNLIRRRCADLSRWSRTSRGSARPSLHPAKPRSASHSSCRATRASPPPPRVRRRYKLW